MKLHLGGRISDPAGTAVAAGVLVTCTSRLALRCQAVVIRDLLRNSSRSTGPAAFDQAAHGPVRAGGRLGGLPRHDAHDLRQLTVARDRRGIEFHAIQGLVVRSDRRWLRVAGLRRAWRRSRCWLAGISSTQRENVTAVRHAKRPDARNRMHLMAAARRSVESGSGAQLGDPRGRVRVCAAVELLVPS